MGNWKVLLQLVTFAIALPAATYAQEATLTGTISDSTGGVLPGVTVTATHTDTGNTFVAVTDEPTGHGCPRLIVAAVLEYEAVTFFGLPLAYEVVPEICQ